MKRRRWLAAALVLLALGGCTPGVAGSGQTQPAPYGRDSGAGERNGVDGGGGGGSGM